MSRSDCVPTLALAVAMALAIFQCFQKDTKIASLIALATFQPLSLLRPCQKRIEGGLEESWSL